MGQSAFLAGHMGSCWEGPKVVQSVSLQDRRAAYLALPCCRAGWRNVRLVMLL
jgi:hypothetical protein